MNGYRENERDERLNHHYDVHGSITDAFRFARTPNLCGNMRYRTAGDAARYVKPSSLLLGLAFLFVFRTLVTHDCLLTGDESLANRELARGPCPSFYAAIIRVAVSIRLQKNLRTLFPWVTKTEKHRAKRLTEHGLSRHDRVWRHVHCSHSGGNFPCRGRGMLYLRSNAPQAHHREERPDQRDGSGAH